MTPRSTKFPTAPRRKKRRPVLSWVVLALAAALSCGPPSAQLALANADLAGVKALAEAYVEAALDGDTAALLALYDEQATQLPANGTPRVGRQAIRAALDPLSGGYTQELSYWGLAWSPDAHGEGLVYDWGSYGLEVAEIGSSESVLHRGTFLVVLKKQSDGSWSIWLEAWTSDDPAIE